MGLPLPNTLPEFLRLVRSLLGNVYDMKHIAKSCGFEETMGLVRIADELGITRPEGWKHHQAGHDSLLIGQVFWKIKEQFSVNEDYFAGVVHGAELSNLVPMAAPPQMSCLAPQGFYFGVDLSQGLFYYTSPIMSVYRDNWY